MRSSKRTLRPAPRGRPRRPRRGAFTLIELLTVIVIIGMLAAMSLAALASARQSARQYRTRALVTKIDQVLMDRMESYRTRRVPITIPRYVPAGSPFGTAGNPFPPRVAAQFRLAALRDIIRMEMPECWADISTGPIARDPGDGGAPIQRPGLSQTLLQIHNDFNAQTEFATFQNAECLYLTIMYGDPEARELFSDRDIGDADGDGLLEFHDGWGNPIQWVRSPCAWTDTQRQPSVLENDRVADVIEQWDTNYRDPSTNTLADQALLEDHDPLDPLKLSAVWRTVPLVYSAGPDGQYDVISAESVDVADTPNDFSDDVPAITTVANVGDLLTYPCDLPFGAAYDIPTVSVTLGATSAASPLPPDGELNHFDNIHSHQQ